jgi:hypothetical protein
MEECNGNMRRCNFCLLLRRRFIGRSVDLLFKCGTEGVNGASGFVQPSSFEDNMIKLFSESSGGVITAVICCDDIVGIQFIENEPTVTDVNSFMEENKCWSYNSDLCDICRELLNDYQGRLVLITLRGVSFAQPGVIIDVRRNFIELQVNPTTRIIFCCDDICNVAAIL